LNRYHAPHPILLGLQGLVYDGLLLGNKVVWIHRNSFKSFHRRSFPATFSVSSPSRLWLLRRQLLGSSFIRSTVGLVCELPLLRFSVRLAVNHPVFRSPARSTALRSSLVRLRARCFMGCQALDPSKHDRCESCFPNSLHPSASSFSKSFRAKIGDSTAWLSPVSPAASLNAPATAATSPL
jgi:hypothetical protein